MDARGPKYTINGIGFSSIKAVQEHCRGIKDRATNGIAPEWGVYFSIHVDHESPTFKELDQQFFGDWIPDVVDDGQQWQLFDDVKASWQEFHRKHAKLRCVTKAFNLSRKDAAHESP